MARRKLVTELKSILAKIPNDKQPIASRLADELVFMQATLADLKQLVKETGTIEHFQQGKQDFLRESPALRSYNTTLKQYNATFKQLCDLLPKEDTTRSTGNPLYDFIEDKDE